MQGHDLPFFKPIYLFAGCALVWVSCNKGPGFSTNEETLSLTERLDEGEVRAGIVTDTSALFGGVSAEGKVGDIKIYNDRARFVIQSAGQSNYYVGYGGSVIDADIVRPFGQPGHDLLDDSNNHPDQHPGP